MSKPRTSTVSYESNRNPLDETITTTDGEYSHHHQHQPGVIRNERGEIQSTNIATMSSKDTDPVVPTMTESDQVIPAKVESDHVLPTMISGGIAGCVSKTAMAPLSRLTILYQVDSALNPSSSSISTVASNHSPARVLNMSQLTRKIIQEEGFLSLWRGNFTSVIHRFPYSAINFSVYETTKKFLKNVYHFDESVGIRFGCGALGGATACIACYPLDIIRTRLTINPSKLQSSSSPIGCATSSTTTTTSSTKSSSVSSIYSRIKSPSILQTFESIIQKEGVKGLYRGLIVSLSVCVPNLAVGFSTYGAVKEHILESHYNFLKTEDSEQLNVFGALISGASSGIMSSLLVFPADVIRRRMQVRGMTTTTSSSTSSTTSTSSSTTTKQTASSDTKIPKLRIIDEVKQLWRLEGARGFYRGLTPELTKRNN